MNEGCLAFDLEQSPCLDVASSKWQFVLELCILLKFFSERLPLPCLLFLGFDLYSQGLVMCKHFLDVSCTSMPISFHNIIGLVSYVMHSMLVYLLWLVAPLIWRLELEVYPLMTILRFSLHYPDFFEVLLVQNLCIRQNIDFS